MKIQQSIDYFFAWGIHRYSRRTLILYIGLVRQFAGVVGDMQLYEITAMEHIITYAEKLRNRGITEGTINLHLVALRQWWKFCERILCDEHDIKLCMRYESIPIRSHIKPNSHRPVTTTEWYKIEKVFERETTKDIRDEALMRMMYATGLRVSELSALNVNDVDIEANEILAITRKRRDMANRRTVPYTKDVTRVLQWWLPILATLHENNEQALFVGLRGTGRLSTRQIERIFQEYIKKSKIVGKRTPHSMRHAFGQRLASAQMYHPYLQILMGHRSPASSQVYYNIQNNDVRKAYREAIGA